MDSPPKTAELERLREINETLLKMMEGQQAQLNRLSQQTHHLQQQAIEADDIQPPSETEKIGKATGKTTGNLIWVANLILLIILVLIEWEP